MFLFLPKTYHDHATLNHSGNINNGLFHTLITSYIRANIYRFIYSTWLSKYYQKILINHTYTHTHTHTHIYIYIYIYIDTHTHTFTNQGHTST